jgi:hypothetical protein
MSDKLNILSLMKEDHHQIESLIEILNDSLGKSYDEIQKHFEKFEWKLEKHIFIEEKAIFTFYEPEDINLGYSMLPTLMKQHNYILNELNKMRKDVKNRKTLKDLENLKIFLLKHRNYEERDVYPKLEDSLKEEQKKQIIDRINEMI